jgi:hypothetical protein
VGPELFGACVVEDDNGMDMYGTISIEEMQEVAARKFGD